MRGTGLKTCSPTKRSGRSLAAASFSIDSDDVVVASTASGASSRLSVASRSAFAPWFSMTASTT